MEETVRIKATGVEIVDFDSSINQISIVLAPGESKLIDIQAKNNNWSVQSSVFYKIESLN